MVFKIKIPWLSHVKDLKKTLMLSQLRKNFEISEMDKEN